MPFSSVGNSCAGNKLMDWISSNVRCVSTSKVRIESISSSKKSKRNGTVLPIGKRSKSEPRTAYSPCSSTCSTERYPADSNCNRNFSMTRRSPFLIKRTLCCRYFGGHTRCINVLIGKIKMPFLLFCK